MRWLRPARVQRDTPQPAVTFSICVCAYNEAAVIRAKVENFLELRRRAGQLQILVYVDGATDGTAEILKPYASQIDLVVSPQRRGKAYGLNRLSALATGDVLVLTDANVHIEPGALVNMARYFQDPEVGCVCGHLTYVNAGETATATTGSLYWRLEEWIKQLESDTGSVMGADGSLYAVRRQLYRPIPRNVADDMYLSLRVLCEGYRIVRAPDVRAFERSVPSAAEEFRRKVRISCQAFVSHRLLWPRLRRMGLVNTYKYISHKLLRWFTVVFLGFATILGLAALTRAAGLPIAVSAVVTAAIVIFVDRYWRLPLVTVVVDALWSFVATGVGVWRALRGQRFRIWTPASSIRDSSGSPT
jgi:cellulose synthase/poly-beta-1,6-N-acetylglucosamine synthase-like glycosyltransferase